MATVEATEPVLSVKERIAALSASQNATSAPQPPRPLPAQKPAHIDLSVKAKPIVLAPLAHSPAEPRTHTNSKRLDNLAQFDSGLRQRASSTGSLDRTASCTPNHAPKPRWLKPTPASLATAAIDLAAPKLPPRKLTDTPLASSSRITTSTPPPLLPPRPSTSRASSLSSTIPLLSTQSTGPPLAPPVRRNTRPNTTNGHRSESPVDVLTAPSNPPPLRRTALIPPPQRQASVSTLSTKSSSLSSFPPRQPLASSIPRSAAPPIRPPLIIPKRRPTDPRSRKRYEALFEKLLCREPTGRPGWIKEEQESLGAATVKAIWERSRLSKAFLRVAWDTCDTEKRGRLSRDQFVRGLWEIDEELRRCRNSLSKKLQIAS